MDDSALIAAAREAAINAYAPYSKFRVGAVVVDEDGKTYRGANIENSAYPSTVCAEATAIAHAASSGARKIDTVAVACIDSDEPGYPCGNCRQMMVEFEVERVLVAGPDGFIEHTLEDLIPHGFKFSE